MPFQKAQKGDEQQLLSSLAGDPYYNLFAISALRSGLGPDVDAWVSEGGGMLIRRHSNWMLQPDSAFDFAAAAAIVDGYPQADVRTITGRFESVDPFAARMARPGARWFESHLAALDGPPATMTYSGTPRPATPADFPGLVAVYANAGHMSRTPESVAQIMPTLWVVESGGEIVSGANLAGETDVAGMIGSVVTPVQHRRHGYAGTAVHALCTYLQGRGKRPCLFYDNPAAGSIYLRIGFRDIGPWRMVKFPL